MTALNWSLLGLSEQYPIYTGARIQAPGSILSDACLDQSSLVILPPKQVADPSPSPSPWSLSSSRYLLPPPSR